MEIDPLEVGIALGCGTGDSVLLLYAETATLHVIHSGNCNRVAVLPHSDRFPVPGKQHAFIGGGFFHLVGAVGQNVAARAGAARLVRSEGHEHLAHGVGGAIYHHGVGAAVDDFKINARKRRVALGCAPHLAVLLGDVNTAPDYLVFSFVLQHLSVL